MRRRRPSRASKRRRTCRASPTRSTGKLEALVQRRREVRARSRASCAATPNPCSRSTTSPTRRAARAARHAGAARPARGPLRRRAQAHRADPRAAGEARRQAAVRHAGRARSSTRGARSPAARRRTAYRPRFAAVIAAISQADALRRDRKRDQGGQGRAPRSARRGAALGYVNDVLQPTVDKAGVAELAISRRPRQRALRAAYALAAEADAGRRPTRLPRRATRSTSPTSGPRAMSRCRRASAYAPVTIAVWDSGVDSALFKATGRDGRRRQAGADRASTSIRIRQRRAAGRFPPDLQRQAAADEVAAQGLLGPAVEHRQPGGQRGQAAAVGADAGTSTSATIEELGSPATTSHGTHVAGIAVEGNPYARLLIARIEFGYTLMPDPCPSRELAEGREELAGRRRLLEEERRARRQHELGRQRQGHRGRSRALRHRQDAGRAQGAGARVLRHPASRR